MIKMSVFELQKECSCPQGFYCPRNELDSKPCPVGHYTEPTLPGQPGAESLSDCIPCRAGTYRCVNRYRRGLQTCPQANLAKISTLFSSLFFQRVRATSMTQRRAEKTLTNLSHSRLCRLTPGASLALFLGQTLILT